MMSFFWTWKIQTLPLKTGDASRVTIILQRKFGPVYCSEVTEHTVSSSDLRGAWEDDLTGEIFKFYYYFWPFCTWHLLSSDSAQDAVKSTITTVMSYFVICILGNIKKDFYNLCVMQVKWVGARWLREGLWVPCEFLHLLHACAAYINLCVCVREGERGEVSQRKVCVMSSPGRLCCGPSSSCCQVVVVS